MTYSGTITYGGVTLQVPSLTPKRNQKTIKQVIGKTLTEVNIIGLSAQQWTLQINGLIVSDIDTTRDALEALDDSQPHAYVDGKHDGQFFIVPNSLTFQDSGERGGMSYTYSVTLVEQ